MYLLDTNIIAELRKFHRNSPHSLNENVKNWLLSVEPEQTYISVITIMESYMGILLKERKDIAQGQILRHWFETYVQPVYKNRTLPINAEIAQLCANLHIPNKRPFCDAYIAATALVHNFTLVTRNVKDFQDIPKLKLLNPFEDVIH